MPMWRGRGDKKKIIVNLEHCFSQDTAEKEKNIILLGPDLNPELPGAKNDNLPLGH